MRRRAFLVSLLLSVLAAAGAEAAVPGVVRPVACVAAPDSVAGTTCTAARGLSDVAFLAVSRDGRNLYVAGRLDDAIAVFARNPATGGLKQLAGTAGCLARTLATCAVVPALDRPSELVVSPDGRNVYVPSQDSSTLTVWARSSTTGGLTLMGCFVSDAVTAIPGCTSTPGLRGAQAVVVSSDGSSVYVSAYGESGLTVWGRDLTTGALTPTACFIAFTAPGCTVAPGLQGATTLTVSPDGKNVYVASRDTDAVGMFARDTGTGALTALGCLTQDFGASSFAGCTRAPALDTPQGLVVSPDGRFAYVAATDSGAVTTLARDQVTGVLTSVPPPEGCVSDAAVGDEVCRLASGLDRTRGLALTSDASMVYVASFGSGTVGSFQRDPVAGGLTQFGPCTASDDPNCEQAFSFQRAGYPVLSPDDRFLYVAAGSSSTVRIFARAHAGPPVAIPPQALRVRSRRIQVKLRCASTAHEGCSGLLRVGTPRRIIYPSLVDVASPTPYWVGVPRSRGSGRARRCRSWLARTTVSTLGEASGGPCAYVAELMPRPRQRPLE
jgi:6-phosphogluconolactonase (cycloisomerase 2 family)